MHLLVPGLYESPARGSCLNLLVSTLSPDGPPLSGDFFTHKGCKLCTMGYTLNRKREKHGRKDKSMSVLSLKMPHRATLRLCKAFSRKTSTKVLPIPK